VLKAKTSTDIDYNRVKICEAMPQAIKF